MDAKEEKFTLTFMVGEQMIERNHYSSDKVRIFISIDSFACCV